MLRSKQARQPPLWDVSMIEHDKKTPTQDVSMIEHDKRTGMCH